MMSKAIQASAPGKLLLLGEYTVLEGAPALVTAVNRRAEVTLQDSADQRWQLSAPQLGLDGFILDNDGAIPDSTDEETKRVLRLFATVLQCVAEQIGALDAQQIHIDTGAFFHGNQKLGIGSSAAVAVALTGALLTALGKKPENELLFKLAAQAHQNAQGGVGSNVDIAASVYGGTFIHQINTAPKQISLPAGLYIQPVFTGRAASTPNLVKDVYRLREQSPSQFSAHMAAMTRLAELGRDACQKADSAGLLELANKYHMAMRDLGHAAGADIISRAHAELHEIAMRAGFGYKPSGAGGGDIGLLFFQPPQHIDSIHQKLKTAGFETIALEQCAPGFKVM